MLNFTKHFENRLRLHGTKLSHRSLRQDRFNCQQKRVHCVTYNLLECLIIHWSIFWANHRIFDFANSPCEICWHSEISNSNKLINSWNCVKINPNKNEEGTVLCNCHRITIGRLLHMALGYAAIRNTTNKWLLLQFTRERQKINVLGSELATPVITIDHYWPDIKKITHKCLESIVQDPKPWIETERMEQVKVMVILYHNHTNQSYKHCTFHH